MTQVFVERLGESDKGRESWTIIGLRGAWATRFRGRDRRPKGSQGSARLRCAWGRGNLFFSRFLSKGTASRRIC